MDKNFYQVGDKVKFMTKKEAQELLDFINECISWKGDNGSVDKSTKDQWIKEKKALEYYLNNIELGECYGKEGRIEEITTPAPAGGNTSKMYKINGKIFLSSHCFDLADTKERNRRLTVDKEKLIENYDENEVEEEEAIENLVNVIEKEVLPFMKRDLWFEYSNIIDAFLTYESDEKLWNVLMSKGYAFQTFQAFLRLGHFPYYKS